MPDPIATFTRDGVTRHAYTRADVVQLKFDGWQQQAQAAAVERPPVPPGAVPVTVQEPDTSLDLGEIGDQS